MGRRRVLVVHVQVVHVQVDRVQVVRVLVVRVPVVRVLVGSATVAAVVGAASSRARIPQQAQSRRETEVAQRICSACRDRSADRPRSVPSVATG